MRIAEGYDVKLVVYDIETPTGCFDIGIYDPDENKWTEFEISKYRNDLRDFVKFYLNNPYKFWVSFNGIGFDHQVLQYILESAEEWDGADGHEIAGWIAEFSDRIIDDGKYDIPPPYKEEQFPVNCIDLFRIHHFNNKQRRTSLKWCAFMMNMDVEEMPIHHKTEHFTQKMIDELKSYRTNDVLVTYELLKLTIGITDVPELADYKGKNKIQDRIDVMKETGMECLNWSDVQIGEEWNKADYLRSIKVKHPGDIFPKKVKHPFGKKFKEFFPKSMDFKSKELGEFSKKLGEEYIKNKKQEFPVSVGRSVYTVAKGGIHSTEKHRNILPAEGWRLTDIDVQSQYPQGFLKFQACPMHLDPILYAQVRGKIDKRVTLKNKAKALKEAGNDSQARPYMSVQEMLKLALNGGLYGKLGQQGSFLEYPEGVMKICIGNQIEILMLVEMMESHGFHVVSGNTDGIMVLYPEAKENVFLATCKEWEEKVGNNDLGKLEHTNFSGLWQESVNHYIGKKVDGTVKKKGRFVTIYGGPGCELNKNKSKRIIAMALEEYFINGTSPIDFITSHKNIYDFCIAKKAYGDLHYEEIINEKKTIIHKKLIRYYVSTDGNVMMKRGLDQFGKPMNNHCEAIDKDFFWMGQPKVTYFNKEISRKFEEYNVNFSYYILEALKRIDKIERTDKAKIYADTFKTKQMSLF